MKKMILFAFVLVLLFGAGTASGEEEESATVFFGAYEQDDDFENGQEPIEWIVLDVQDDFALLTSCYVLDYQPFNEEKEETSWERSSLREWLNNEFLRTAFTDEERNAIAISTICNDEIEQNPEWETVGTETEDEVFLLSYGEAMWYFLDADSRKTECTTYAFMQGGKLFNTDWWVRTSGKTGQEAGYIGVLRDIGTKSVKDKGGVRPAIWVSIEAWQNTFFRYDYFGTAMQFESEGKYAEAIEQYEALGDYNNSAARITECQYQIALEQMNARNYADALDMFEQLGDYQDSEQQGRECRYQMAETAYDVGDYDRAMFLFEKVGQYKNSMEKMKNCFDKTNIRVRYFSDKKPVDAGVDTGYSKTEKIGEKDPHYGWKLGQFFISGYTDDEPAGDGQIVFVRTVGDTPTLWFNLQQDIDALNGNDKLVIGEDTNGYDQYFETAKTNFGRGTLIVRHTDTQNREGEVNIYTDYLLAKGTTGANTKIELNEEGKYEIALDYEIQNNELTHIVRKYHNYRIAFEFQIRNGNNMVFLLDMGNNAELQNGAVTTSGFRIDWAGSKELEVKVRYSVLQQSVGYVTEDVRFERPTKDKDIFEDEGIYTITINESVTKKIIVNPRQNDLLERYAENGFSTEGLK